MPVTCAEPAPPVSWLAAVAGSAPDTTQGAFPGNDGARIFLPPRSIQNGAEETLRRYLLLAVQQAVRITRASASMALRITNREARDRFLLADAAAVDDWIVRHTPGLVPALCASRKDAMLRRGAWPRGDRERTFEADVREFLASDPVSSLRGPLCGNPADTGEWGRKDIRGNGDSEPIPGGIGGLVPGATRCLHRLVPLR